MLSSETIVTPTADDAPRPRPGLLFGCAALVVFAVHLVADPATEPFFNNDETRHVMTGVFVRDALADLPASAADPKGYAVRYYVQHPALGVLTWPPVFYLAEGAAMAVGGTSYLTARVVVGLFALLAGWYTFRLTLRTHGAAVAALAVLLLGLSPLVFEYSRRVMLEVPTLAMVLAAVFHFERYLGAERPRDAVLACLFAALAALTRFDGVVLLPYFALRLVARRRVGLLARRPVLIGLLLALALTVPYYQYTWRVYGAGLSKTAGEGTRPEDGAFLNVEKLAFYPAAIPEQVGWPMAIAAAIGLLASVRAGRSVGPYLGLLAATYVTFTPLAEHESRHAIYWVPALAVFAAAGVAWVATGSGSPPTGGEATEQNPRPLRERVAALRRRVRGTPPALSPKPHSRETWVPLTRASPGDACPLPQGARESNTSPPVGEVAAQRSEPRVGGERSAPWFRFWLGMAAALVVVIGTGWDAVSRPAWWVTGYADAARYVAAHAAGDRPVLMDGLLNGSFVYHVRRADPDRRLTVLRGDKLLYSMFSDPRTAYTELAGTEDEVLAILDRYDPEWVVVEQPQLYFTVRGAELLRTVLRDHPEKFRLEHTVPIRSNHVDRFGGARLEIYRKLDRNPHPTPAIEFPVFGLGGWVRQAR